MISFYFLSFLLKILEKLGGVMRECEGFIRELGKEEEGEEEGGDGGDGGDGGEKVRQWVHFKNSILVESKKILPDLQVLIALLQRSIKAVSEAPNSPSPHSSISSSPPLLLERTLKVITGYQHLSPQCVIEANFDVTKILKKAVTFPSFCLYSLFRLLKVVPTFRLALGEKIAPQNNGYSFVGDLLTLVKSEEGEEGSSLPPSFASLRTLLSFLVYSPSLPDIVVELVRELVVELVVKSGVVKGWEGEVGLWVEGLGGEVDMELLFVVVKGAMWLFSQGEKVGGVSSSSSSSSSSLTEQQERRKRVQEKVEWLVKQQQQSCLSPLTLSAANLLGDLAWEVDQKREEKKKKGRKAMETEDEEEEESLLLNLVGRLDEILSVVVSQSASLQPSSLSNLVQDLSLIFSCPRSATSASSSDNRWRLAPRLYHTLSFFHMLSLSSSSSSSTSSLPILFPPNTNSPKTLSKTLSLLPSLPSSSLEDLLWKTPPALLRDHLVTFVAECPKQWGSEGEELFLDSIAKYFSLVSSVSLFDSSFSLLAIGGEGEGKEGEEGGVCEKIGGVFARLSYLGLIRHAFSFFVSSSLSLSRDEGVIGGVERYVRGEVEKGARGEGEGREKFDVVSIVSLVLFLMTELLSEDIEEEDAESSSSSTFSFLTSLLTVIITTAVASSDNQEKTKNGSTPLSTLLTLFLRSLPLKHSFSLLLSPPAKGLSPLEKMCVRCVVRLVVLLVERKEGNNGEEEEEGSWGEVIGEGDWKGEGEGGRVGVFLLENLKNLGVEDGLDVLLSCSSLFPLVPVSSLVEVLVWVVGKGTGEEIVEKKGKKGKKKEKKGGEGPKPELQQRCGEAACLLLREFTMLWSGPGMVLFPFPFSFLFLFSFSFPI